MILDRGICNVYHKTNTAEPGGKPVWSNVLIHTSYYAELSFETAPGRPTQYREEINTAARIRILQKRTIANHDRVQLTAFDGTGESVMYEVTRAYHGQDDESGEAITDLTLEVVTP